MAAKMGASRLFPTFREISETVRDNHFNKLAEFYDNLKKKLLTGDAAKLKAGLLTLAACQDKETTPDGEHQGVFTQALLDVLASNPPPANYDDLIIEIRKMFADANPPQTPAINPIGQEPAFRAQQPFVI